MRRASPHYHVTVITTIHISTLIDTLHPVDGGRGGAFPVTRRDRFGTTILCETSGTLHSRVHYAASRCSAHYTTFAVISIDRTFGELPRAHAGSRVLFSSSDLVKKPLHSIRFSRAVPVVCRFNARWPYVQYATYHAMRRPAVTFPLVAFH